MKVLPSRMVRRPRYQLMEYSSKSGSTPTTFIAKKLGVKVDQKGYIKVDSDQKTNVPGIFAAGDITTNSSEFKQIVTAVSEGAVAVYNAYIELKS